MINKYYKIHFMYLSFSSTLSPTYLDLNPSFYFVFDAVKMIKDSKFKYFRLAFHLRAHAGLENIEDLKTCMLIKLIRARIDLKSPPTPTHACTRT